MCSADETYCSDMLPYYQHLCDELKWPKETGLIEQMKGVNDDKLSQLDATIKDAVENLGESEVREANLAKANFFTRIGDKVCNPSTKA